MSVCGDRCYICKDRVGVEGGGRLGKYKACWTKKFVFNCKTLSVEGVDLYGDRFIVQTVTWLSCTTTRLYMSPIWLESTTQ